MPKAFSLDTGIIIVTDDRLNFASGHGLLYTTSSYGELTVKLYSESQDAFIAVMEISNTGSNPGGAVVHCILVGSPRS